MQGLRYAAWGAPLDVLELVELDAIDPGPDEIVVDVAASPIDPMDLLLVRGHYPVCAELPAFAGAEGCGRVAAIGRDVTSVRVGAQVVLPVRCGAWRQRVCVPADQACEVPEDVDPVQASMLRVNPLTADVMLESFVDLAPGQWLIQSPGSGSVGQFVVQLARRRGLRTVSVVRRDDRVDVVQRLGSDVVLVDGPDLIKRVRAEVGRVEVRLGLDGTGGETAGRLASCLTPGGTLVSYGAMSRRAPQIGLDALVFRGVEHRGFWLFNWTKESAREHVHERLRRLADLRLHGEIAATYALADWRSAVEHAQRHDRRGRVVLCPADAR